MRLLADLLEELPQELARQVFTHASWSERRSDSYARLAFLGDSVLALAVTAHLYPRLEADSLDLYTLVQELEDTYGVQMSDEQAAKILTVGQAVDFVLAHDVATDNQEHA